MADDEEEGEGGEDDAKYVEDRKKAKEEGGKKKKKKGFFGFGGGEKKEKKTEEEKKEEKAAADKAKANAQKIEEETKRVAEAEAAERLKAKKERQQELLKKDLDPSPRVFQFNMKAMKIQNVSKEEQRGMFFTVTLGGDYKEEEKPGKGLVKEGKKGQQFTTAPSKKVEDQGFHYVIGEFGAGVPIYWIGAYGDLEVQDFMIEIFTKKGMRSPIKKAEYRTPLSALAQSSIQQEIELEEIKGAEKQPFAIITMIIYFQELYQFQLKFTGWSGFNLRASDAPKRKERIKQSMTAEEKEKEKKEKKEAKEEEKKQKLKEKRDKLIEKRRKARAPKKKKGEKLPAAPVLQEGEGGEGEGEEGAQLLEGDGPKSDGEKQKGKKKKLSYEERKAMDKKNQEARKKAADAKFEAKLQMVKKREEKEKERIRKLAEEQDKKKNKVYDPELYEEATSDPYVVFSIDPPSAFAAGCKIFKPGGYFGRKTQTEPCLHTLFPKWEEARNPLAYLGTRSELENEILRVKVYDWDLKDSDDLIGKADVPLSGVLEYGQVEVDLTYEEDDVTAKKIKGVTPKKILPAGRLQGQILFDGEQPVPQYKQIGTIVERREGVTYLAVRVIKAKKMKPADLSGFSDPFVTVEWDGSELSTKIIMKNLNPVWNETLYFPLKCAINKGVIEKKPGVTVRVYDFDEAGPDLLGSCDVPLHKITAADLAQLDDEVLPNGKKHKGRVLRCEGTKLVLPEQQIESTIDFWLYFTPDLPLEITLDEVKTKGGRAIDSEYESRCQQWWEELPEWVQKPLQAAQKLENASDKVTLSEPKFNIKALISAEDQDANVHMFCEYLTPVLPPSELNDVGKLARMVRMITWEHDEETFSGSRKNVWQGPNFFMEIQKGDFEDHAIYLCNLLLGLNMDAYVCVGRLHTAKKGDKPHIWVMIREEDGNVRIWETSTGDDLELEGRWRGTDEGIRKREAAEAAKKAAEEAEANPDAGKKKKKRRERKGKKKGKGKDEAPEPAPLPEVPMGPLDGDEDEEGEQKPQQPLVPLSEEEQMREYARDLQVDMNDDEVLGTSSIKEPKREIRYADLEAAPAGDSGDKAQASGAGAGAGASAGSSQLSGMPVNFMLKDTVTPYAQLEVVFNNKNLYASKQYYDPSLKKGTVNQLDPALLTYDFEDANAWEPFLTPSMRAESKPECFYSPRRVSPKLAKDRIATMEQQIEGEIKSQLKMARGALPTSVNTMKEFVAELKEYLEFQETVFLNPANEVGDQAKKDSKNWERKVKGKVPAGSRFKGRPINFTYSDAKRIRKKLFSECDYASSREDGLEFFVAVRCFGYAGGVVSTWIYYGILDKPDKDD